MFDILTYSSTVRQHKLLEWSRRDRNSRHECDDLSTSSHTMHAIFEKRDDFHTGPTMNMGFIQMLYESHSAVDRTQQKHNNSSLTRK